MKRWISLFLFLVLFPASCLAGPGVVLCYRMNFYASAYNEDHPGYFDFDTIIIDVYLMDDFKTAYYSKTVWNSGDISSSGYIKCAIVKNTSDYTLVFPDQSEMSFSYDENGAFWLQMEGGSYRLLPCERFDISKDLKSN